MTTGLAAAVVQRQLDAYNAHDLDAFLATHGDDVVVYRPPAAVPALSGKPQLAEFYRTSRFNIAGLHAELVHRTILGDSRVVDHERITGLRDQPVEVIAVYTVRGNLIREVWLFNAE